MPGIPERWKCWKNCTNRIFRRIPLWCIVNAVLMFRNECQSFRNSWRRGVSYSQWKHDVLGKYHWRNIERGCCIRGELSLFSLISNSEAGILAEIVGTDSLAEVWLQSSESSKDSIMEWKVVKVLVVREESNNVKDKWEFLIPRIGTQICETVTHNSFYDSAFIVAKLINNTCSFLDYS